MATNKRVQVADLADAPRLQATIQSGGNYNVAVQQAGRNKLMDLADALSQVNPMLRDYAVATKMRREDLMEQGAIQFAENPAELSQQLKQFKSARDITERKIRKLVEQGALPPGANPIRLLGALQAKAEVMVKRDYRAELMNAETLLQTDDPEVDILRVRSEFLKRGEFDSSIITKSALKQMEAVEQEFRGTVQRRLTNKEIEEGQQNWAELGRDPIEHVINGQIDINAPSVKDWLNHPAGMFQGSRKYAWNTLIREELLEGLTTPVSEDGEIGMTKYTPSQVKTFLRNLRELNLGNGAKFADHDTGLAITSFMREVDSMTATVENANAAVVNKATEGLVGEASNVFFAKHQSGTLTIDTYNTEVNKLLANVPSHKKDSAVASLTARFKSIQNLTEDEDDVKRLVGSDIQTLIEDGTDLTSTKDKIKQAYLSNQLTLEQYDKYNNRLEASRDFVEVVKSKETYKTYKTQYEDIILGVTIDERSGSKARNVQGSIFKNLKNTSDTSLFDEIKDAEKTNKLGSLGLQLFMNKRYNTFNKMLLEMTEKRYTELEQEKTIAPEKAASTLYGEMEELTSSLFQRWTEETIKQANLQFKINFKQANQ